MRASIHDMEHKANTQRHPINSEPARPNNVDLHRRAIRARPS